MYTIGLTGGIACGKSAVASEINRLCGAFTFDIDRVTHALLQPGGVLFSVYVEHFGKYIISADGQLNRRLIGEIIFNHPEEREWINSVAHPILLNKMRDFLINCASKGISPVVVEVPLLFDVGWEKFFDEVWAVKIAPSQQLWRLMQRDKLTPQQAMSRIRAQMPIEEICSRADVVINNKHNVGKLRRQVKRALSGKYISLWEGIFIG